MSELNKKYRGRATPTNVLSFSMLEGEERPFSDMLGDIVISLETANREAVEEGVSLEEKVRRLLAHGLLHLLGYDHETDSEERIMGEKEDRLIGIMGGANG